MVELVYWGGGGLGGGRWNRGVMADLIPRPALMVQQNPGSLRRSRTASSATPTDLSVAPPTPAIWTCCTHSQMFVVTETSDWFVNHRYRTASGRDSNKRSQLADSSVSPGGFTGRALD